MADEFDDLLAQTLAPPNRGPDREFVMRVQAHILLEERLHAERRSALSMLTMQVIGVAAVAAAVFWLVRSPAIESFAGESPAILLMVLLTAFSFVTLLFSSRPGNDAFPASSRRAFSGT